MGEPEFGKKAQSLTSLVDYQNGSVVSRTLLSKSVGNVTLFAFDGDQGLSEHTTPYDAMVLVVEGELEIKIEGKAQKLIGDEVLILPANKPHSVFSSGRSKMLLVMLLE